MLRGLEHNELCRLYILCTLKIGTMLILNEIRSKESALCGLLCYTYSKQPEGEEKQTKQREREGIKRIGRWPDKRVLY